jgi:hypothetical protein
MSIDAALTKINGFVTDVGSSLEDFVYWVKNLFDLSVSTTYLKPYFFNDATIQSFQNIIPR